MSLYGNQLFAVQAEAMRSDGRFNVMGSTQTLVFDSLKAVLVGPSRFRSAVVQRGVFQMEAAVLGQKAGLLRRRRRLAVCLAPADLQTGQREAPIHAEFTISHAGHMTEGLQLGRASQEASDALVQGGCLADRENTLQVIVPGAPDCAA